ncbi:MAG: HAMP domain-containing protein [Planctomycetaceae bacterium]|nr:HAMP domain-containing protein [Planctomycetaceae bacterium]
MRFARLSVYTRSLRFRLLAWNTFVVLLMVVVTLLAVREGLRLMLIREMDQLLEEDLLEIRLAVEQFYPNWDQIQEELNRKAIGHAHRELFVQVLDAQGQPLRSSVNTPDAASSAGTGVLGRTLVGGAFRVMSRPLSKPGLPPLTIRVGSTLRFVREDVANLSRMSIWVAIALLPLAGWGGYWLAGRATKPLAQIIRMAARLRPSQLDERLPIRRTGDELDQLSRTINGLLDRIADYLAQNREFIANAAHELRSPLAAIQSSVEVNLNAARTIGEYQELLGEIAEECSSLTGLVNQLLLLAESDAGPSQLIRQPVLFDRIVNKSLDMFHGAAEERGVELHAQRLDRLVVSGDPNRLWQVVNNLIDNALKFSRPGGNVSVELRYEPQRAAAVLRVSDAGVGIPPEDLPHVFERFFQGDRSRQRESPTRGNGLGLSICQSIVQAHGGTISVQSVPGKGTQFTVILAAQPAEDQGTLIPATETAAH